MSKEVDLREAWQLLMGAQSLVLVSHVGPDGDTLGSTLGLARALKLAGKRVRLLVDDILPAVYQFLPGLEAYEQPKAGEKIPCDLTVVVDASSKDRMGEAEKCLSAPILNIDHHVSNTRYADYLLLDEKAAATGEIMYLMLEANRVPVDQELATDLYTAIVTDCGYFKYANTTPRCLRVAADLLERGVRPDEISDQLELKARNSVELLAKVLPSLHFYAGGRIATLEVPFALYDKTISTESFIYHPRYIAGVDVAVLFKQVEPKSTRVSMRSKQVDVSKVAVAFNGGGHPKAAGCTIGLPLEEAKKALLEALEKALEAL
ncbi:bifunctional oligoribonuclease/PAP phosphatase NrnA [Acidaminococcus sp. DS4831]|uniref:DHH family phosphoesterase n=1 Tax=Acidaminococcus sp. DS4831 TaxID=3141399 RepID=UPI0032E4C2AD